MWRFISKYQRKNTSIGDYEWQLMVRNQEHKTINMNLIEIQLKDNESIEISIQHKSTN